MNDLEQFISAKCETWDFNDLISKYKKNNNVFVKFSFEFSRNGSNINDRFKGQYYLASDGKFKEIKKDDYQKESDRFFFYVELKDMLNIKNNIYNKIKKITKENKITWNNNYECYEFPYKAKNPVRLFTKEELKKILIKGDDSNTNKIVIDGEGYLNLIQSIEEGRFYPCEISSFEAGTDYVGKSIGNADEYIKETYRKLLNGFYEYLKTGEHQFIDDEDDDISESEEELIIKIEEYIKKKN